MKKTQRILAVIAVFAFLFSFSIPFSVFSAQTLQMGRPAPQNSIAAPTLKNASSPIKTIGKISHKNYLVIKKFYIKPNKPHEGDTITIYAKIINTGPVAINNFKVKFSLNNSMISQSKGSLKYRETKEFQVQVKPKAGSFAVKAIVPPGKITGRQFYTGDIAKLSLKVGPPVVVKSRRPANMKQGPSLSGSRHATLRPSDIGKSVSPGKILNVSVKFQKRAGILKKNHQHKNILNIHWSRKGIVPAQVDILLYPFRQSNKSLYLRRNASNNGNFRASIPGKITPGQKYIVRVQTRNGRIYGDSSVFYPVPIKVTMAKPATKSVQTPQATLKNSSRLDNRETLPGQPLAKLANTGTTPSHNTFRRPEIASRAQKGGMANQKIMASKAGSTKPHGLAQLPGNRYPKGIWGGQTPLIMKFQANKKRTLDYGHTPVRLQYEFNSAEEARLYTVPMGKQFGINTPYYTLNPGKPGIVASGAKDVFSNQETTYILWCRNRNGIEKKSLTIGVQPRISASPPEILEFRPNRSIINRGESVRFFYKAKNPFSIFIWSSSLPKPVNWKYTNFKPGIVTGATWKITLKKPGNYRFKIRAWNRDKNWKKNSGVFSDVVDAVVTVLDNKNPKILGFEVNPSSWRKSDSTKPEFLYKFANATSAAIYNYDTGKKLPIDIAMDYKKESYHPAGSSMFSGARQKGASDTLVVSGHIPVTPFPTATTRYLLKIQNGSGKVVSKIFKLEIKGIVYPIIHTFRVNPEKVKYNEPACLEYDFEHANKARIVNYTDKKHRIVFDFRSMRYKGAMVQSLKGERKKGKYNFWHVKKTDVYVLELENENGKVKKSLQLTVEGYPLAGYKFTVKRNTFLGIPLGDVKVSYEFANLEYARIRHLDFRKNKYVTIKNYSYNDLMGKSKKGSFTHKPSNGYFPARYRLIFKDPKFNNEQKMDIVVK